MQEPLTTLTASHNLGPIIIILDALDECGTPETRNELLDLLSSGLLGMFRLSIASRDEPDIRVAFSPPAIIIRDVLIDDQSTTSDISRFFRQRLSSVAPAFASRSLAPGSYPSI